MAISYMWNLSRHLLAAQEALCYEDVKTMQLARLFGCATLLHCLSAISSVYHLNMFWNALGPFSLYQAVMAACHDHLHFRLLTIFLLVVDDVVILLLGVAITMLSYSIALSLVARLQAHPELPPHHTTKIPAVSGGCCQCMRYVL